ncbi:hypothetical protein [uncultured Zobellia sp.]|uniref:hypothetical protein n=1 Tax=uncultured Zobellia sp. TaxID=255433 RepID=UPI0025962F91|nr:hypothetical protein [uncultured Zobellia sp.]
MKNLQSIYESIGLDQRILNIYQEKILPPDFEYRWNPVKDFFYTFPPFFIPLFVDQGEPGYYGIVNHFFLERERTFTFFSLSTGYMWEEARTADQYLADLILGMILSEEEVTDEIIEFTKEIGYDPTDLLWKFLNSDDYNGSTLESYHNLEIFSKNLPFTYVTELNSYEGDFPSSRFGFNPSSLGKASTYELNKKFSLGDFKQDYPWLDEEKNKKTLFDNYFSANELDKAWLSLNSSGWLLEDVANSLEKLKGKTDEKLFHLVANNWIEGMEKANKGKESY